MRSGVHGQHPVASAVMFTILRHEARNVVRNRGVLMFAIGTLVLSDGVLRLTGSPVRALSTMLDLVLFVVPLITMMFGIITWHGSREFTELLLAQPVRRSHLFVGLYLALTAPIALAFALGLSLPFVLRGGVEASTLPLLLSTIGSGVALAAVFGGMALLIGVSIDDRLRGVMLGLMVWLLLTVGYDAMVLLVATTLADYPLERPMLGLMLGNPIDLARSVIVLQSDAAALMGYTGAVMSRFLGSAQGTVAALAGLACWIALPAWLAKRRFARRDF